MSIISRDSLEQITKAEKDGKSTVELKRHIITIKLSQLDDEYIEWIFAKLVKLDRELC